MKIKSNSHIISGGGSISVETDKSEQVMQQQLFNA